MKKKLLSLLLVIAIMVSSVSMGLSAFAAPAGKGIEAINAFSLVDNDTDGVTGTTFSTTITIKSKNASYQIKVNSVTASIRYSDNDTGTAGSVSVQDAVIGAVCGTGGRTFTVSGSIPDGKAGLIRYECNYDLLDANGNAIDVYKGMTGYGYGYVSANGEQSGVRGSYHSKPGDMRDGSYFKSLDTLNTLYVQTATLTLNYTVRAMSFTSQSACTRGVEVISGNAPSSLKTIGSMSWPSSFWSEKTSSGTWLTMTEPASGYYNFTTSFNSWGDSWEDQSNITETSTMYYRRQADQNSALSAATTALNKNLEKSYYTADSWNEYIKALEYAQLAGRAIPQPNNPFRIACQNAGSAASLISNAESKLVFAKADWKDVEAAYLEHFEEKDGKLLVKNNVTTVYTYEAGEKVTDSTTNGETTVTRYTKEATDGFVAWLESDPLIRYNANDIYKYDQARVDNYADEIRRRGANLACADAVYTYLDVAIAEYEAARAEHEALDNRLFTESTWSAYENAVNNAKSLPRTFKTDSQGTINTQLKVILEKKNQLKYGPADTTELLVQIGRADEVYVEYNATPSKILPLEGLEELWKDFETAYSVAVQAKTLTMDKQKEVENAAETLRIAIEALSGYRLLDITELNQVLNTYPPYAKEKYVEESYSAWDDLWVEGFEFKEKALPDYQGNDRKTYDDYDDMERLIEAIKNAYDNLEKIKADFTEINGYVEQIPSERDLALYKDEVVAELKAAVGEINYGATFDEQAAVDAIAIKLKNALAELKYENYKPADYTEVNEAKEKAEALDGSVYTNYSSVKAAINAVDWNKKIVEQDEVDAMAEAINSAIANLEYILADYTEVEKAKADAEAIEHKEWYSNYNRVTEAINAVDWTKNHSQQAEVDAMAAAIRTAIANLRLADADYSGVDDAIADYNALAPLTDFTTESVARVDEAINNVVWGLTADKQTEINAMEAEIRGAIEKMELLPADYSGVRAAIAYAESLDSNIYTNYQIVTDAINAVNWELNCRQGEELQQQIKSITDAVASLELYPADYTKVDEAIREAEDTYTNSIYPYTSESIQAVKDVIASVDRNLKIDRQADVDAYILKIQIAVAQLTYERADYTELDKLLDEYEALDRNIYASLVVIDAYVSKIDMNITVDRQLEVKVYVEELRELLGSLEYAPADYSDVDYEIGNYNKMNKEHYEPYDIAKVDQVIAKVVRGLKMDEQARVDEMARAIRAAVDELRTKMKKADLDALLDAIDKATARVNEMNATGHTIDTETLRALNRLLGLAGDYNEQTTIDSQGEINTLTANIIEATANLEFVFDIILEEPIVIDEYGYIYGFEEGTDSDDARELIGFVGAAELKIYETRNGFGTGTMIQFISTKDGSILGTYTVLVFGDANGDAVIDTFDEAYLAEIVNEGVTPADMLLRVLDFDKDNYVDVSDLSVMIGLANLDYTLMQDGSMGRI